MKHIFSLKILPIVLISNFAFLWVSASAPVVPLISMRSQGQDLARYLSGVSRYIDLPEQECVYGNFAMTIENTQSFKTNKLARCLFGDYTCNSNCPAASIKISGSRVPNRPASDWLADYFYLPTDFQSTVQFTPRIQNLVFDLDFYMGLDKWVQGLFCRFQTPIVWTRWDLNMKEYVQARGVNNYEPGYFDSFVVDAVFSPPIGVGVFRDALLENFTAYASGDTVVLNPTVTFQQLQSALINPCVDAKTSLADLHFTLGYNFFNFPTYHTGIGLYIVAPTGNRVVGDHFFEPIAGNGKHWELGAWFTAHTDVWTDCDETFSIGLYADATLTYMFPTLQTRTFDIKNKPFSRYMLAEQLDMPITSSLAGTPVPPVGPPLIPATAQFKSVFTPVANISTQEVLVTVGIQADIVLQCSLMWNHMQLDIGYNLWARSCEKITSTCPGAPCTLTHFPEQMWGLKGDSYVFGFVPTNTDISVPLSATQSAATINSGTNFANVDVSNPAAIAAARRNPNIDAAQFATANNAGITTGLAATLNGTIPPDQTRTSIPPVFITGNDLDLVGTRGLSNKIYANLSYNWIEREYWIPYLGVGGFAEFASSCKRGSQNCASNSQCWNRCNNSCINCAVSQWGVWLKGGVAF